MWITYRRNRRTEDNFARIRKDDDNDLTWK
jgi:hypothetical protein